LLIADCGFKKVNFRRIPRRVGLCVGHQKKLGLVLASRPLAGSTRRPLNAFTAGLLTVFGVSFSGLMWQGLEFPIYQSLKMMEAAPMKDRY
jgi:hypothetical protein